MKKLLPAILIIVLGFIIYGNSMQGKFVWDDEYLIKFNTYIRNFSNLPQVFTADIGAGSGRWFGFYRPVQITTYALDHALWQLDERGYHFTNIILHILAALMVFWLIQTLFKETLISLVTASFFLVHPVQTAAVAYISGRADPLAVSFMLFAFILYIKNMDTENIFIYAFMLISFACALGSKELSLVLPLLILLYHYSFRKKIKLLYFLPVLILALAYIFVRLTALRHTLALNVPALNQVTLPARIPGFFVAVTHYARLLTAPMGLHMEYGNTPFPFTDWRVAAGLFILAALIAFAIKNRKRNLIIFGTGWCIITLLPMSNLYPINAYMAEHWLYLPSIGLFLVAAGGINYLYTMKRLHVVAVACAAAPAAFWSLVTIQQNTYWKDPVTFYQRTLNYSPGSIRALNDLGRLYEASGKTKEAMELYEKAIQAEPKFALPYNNLGVLYHNTGRDADAVPLYEKALRLDPNYSDALNNLAVTYAGMGKTAEAIELYKRAILAHPNFAGAYNNMGSVYAAAGKIDEAIASFKKATQIDPRFADAYYNLGLVYSKLGRNAEAREVYEKAVTINPAHGLAQINLAVLYYFDKKYDRAVQHCDEAVRTGIRVNPEFLEALQHYRK